MAARFEPEGKVIGSPFSFGSTRFHDISRPPKTLDRGCMDGQTPPRGAHIKVYYNQPTFCVVRHPLTHIVSSMNFVMEPHGPYQWAAYERHRGSKTIGEFHRKRVNAALRRAVFNLRREQTREHNVGFFPDTFNRTILTIFGTSGVSARALSCCDSNTSETNSRLWHGFTARQLSVRMGGAYLTKTGWSSTPT